MSKKLIAAIESFDEKLPDLLGFSKLLDWFKKNSALIFFLSLAGIVAYSGDLVNFSLNIDSENHAYSYGAKEAWVSQGRWGMYVLNRLLLPDAIMPVIPMLLAIVGTVIGALFLVLTLSEKRGLADYLAAPIAIACPVLYFAFYFTTLGYGVGVAFAVTGLGMYMLVRWTLYGAAVAVLSFCFSIGIYQAVLPLIATLFCLYVVSEIIQNQQLMLGTIVRRTSIFVAVIVAAYGLYNIVMFLSLRYMHIGFDTAYISGFMTYQPTWEYLIGALKKTIPVALNYYTGGKDYYLYQLGALKYLFWLTLLISLYRIIVAGSSVLVKVIGVIALFLALAAPMLMHLLNNGYMPPRTTLGISFVLGAMVFFTAGSRSRIIQIVTACLVIACFYKFSVINNRYAFSNAMVWQADKDLSLLMLERMGKLWQQLPPKSIHDQYPMEIVGWSEHLESPIIVQREVIGASFYTWGAGDVERVVRLYRAMGITDYKEATHAQRLEIVERTKKMPSWPLEGSVAVLDGIIVVKLQDYNPNQFLAMCDSTQTANPVCLKYLPR